MGKYEEVEIEVIRFEEEDIIISSENDLDIH
jgi:hypothetical protein